MNITYIDVIIFFIGFFATVWYYGSRPYNHYKDKGIKHKKPFIPFLGSTMNVLFQKEHFIDFVMKHYNMFQDQKYIGLFETRRPLLMLRDLDLIKQIGIKDFDSFPNHRPTINEEMDPLFGNILVSLQNEKWRDMRATLSPAFTSSKMRNMFTLLNDCAEDFAKYFTEEAEKMSNSTVEIETKDAFTRYTNDVIATSAFGLKMNTSRNRDHEFYYMSKDVTDFSGLRLVKFVLFALFPRLCKLVKLRFFATRTASFFRNVVQCTMVNRQKTGVVRHDMIDILMEAKKGSLKHEKTVEDTGDNEFATVEESAIGKRTVTRNWTDDELTAQALIFLIGGFETTSTLTVFFFYEMVKNPDVQKKIQKEIDDFKEKSGGKVTYNDIKEFKYLDMAVSETLRMWPPAIATDRVCSKDFTLPPPTDDSTQNYTVRSGEAIWVPIYAIHHDPKYYPDPEKFEPERFSDENKSSIDLNSYLPFGIGPRNCIGSRYALLVTKILVFHIMSKFDVVMTEKTQIPIKLSKKTFNLWAENGLYIGLKLRDS